MRVGIIDSIRLSHPPFTIYVPCNEQWYEYNHIYLECHRSHLVPSDDGSFFYALSWKVQPSTTPRVGSAEAGGVAGGITMLHLDLLQYMDSMLHHYLLAIYKFNATSVLVAVY